MMKNKQQVQGMDDDSSTERIPIDISVGDIVVSAAGRDCGRCFVVIGSAGDGYVLLADGRRRRVEKPKKKNLRHVRKWKSSEEMIAYRAFSMEMANAEIRRVLSKARS